MHISCILYVRRFIHQYTALTISTSRYIRTYIRIICTCMSIQSLMYVIGTWLFQSPRLHTCSYYLCIFVVVACMRVHVRTCEHVCVCMYIHVSMLD